MTWSLLKKSPLLVGHGSSAFVGLSHVRESTHCCNTKTRQHNATQCNTMQHPATPCNTLQHTVRESTHNVATLYKKRHCNTLQHTVRESTHNVTTLYKKRPPFKKKPARGLSHGREVHSFVATYTRRGLVSKRALLHVMGVFSSLPPYTKKLSSCV